MTLRNRFDVEPVDANQSRIAATEQCARHFSLTLCGHGADADHAGKVARPARKRLRDLDAAMLCHYRGVNHVHTLDDRAEQSREHSLSDGLNVVLAHFT